MRSRDARSWMWGEALSLLEQAERLQRQFFRMGSSPAHAQVWEPPVDVVETADAVWVHVALPGAAADLSVLVRRADRLGRVLDDRNARLAGDLEDRIHVGTQAVEMDGNDRLRPGRQRLPDRGGIGVVRGRVDVHQDGPRADTGDTTRRCEE